jgi:lipopolysaccharide/colanic/teichoic acid biosynthesis glycosyltransferase
MKRFFDFCLSSIGLIILFLPMLLLACIIRLKLGSPVLFKQARIGFKGEPFTIIKFRTMRNNVRSDGIGSSDAERLTNFGRWLRAASLDELPELWNVFMGDMSLVGPRPLLTQYLSLYTFEQARRHEVRPGITGLAQINGRNTISWEEKFHFDLWYVDNHNLLLDVKILLQTLTSLFNCNDINASPDETMPEFMGSKVDK